MRVLYDKLANIRSPEDLADFLELLRDDFAHHKENWENWEVDQFLDAAAAWLRGASDHNPSRLWQAPEWPSWAFVGYLFMAGRSYE